ncbi:MAG: AAA family ATPase [Bacilli bacterium]|nr:AAA family ATPase [Bacilli bacterium]
MIKIEKIEFKNFRQYKDICLTFDKNSDYNLHIVRAKNGTGKTTFLNGILWCLYDEEYYISNKLKALKVVNESAIQEKNEGDIVEVSVKLTISDEDKFLSFERKQIFSVTLDPLTSIKKSVATCEPTLKVLESPKTAFVNTKVYESEEETQRLVKQYFDKEIYSYYFFDGENLKNYFDKENAGKVKSSIYSLSQVNLLSNASKRTEVLANDKRREMTEKNDRQDVVIYDEIDKLKDEIEKLRMDNNQLDIAIPILQKRIDELNDQLIGYKPVRDNQIRREELDKKLKQLEKEQAEMMAKKKEFIRTYYMLFHLFPRIKATLDMIKYKEDHGELPPRIDKKQIEELIHNHDANCPMCDGEINDHAIIHMKQLLEELDVSSQASNYLSSIKGGLELAILKCRQYEDEKKSLLEKEKYYQQEIEETEKELNVISQYLSTYSDSNTVIDVSKIEKERTQKQEELTIKTKRQGANELSIKNSEERLEILDKEAKEMEKKANKNKALQKQMNVLNDLTSCFNQVKKQLMDKIKVEIEENTWNTFKNMIWKKETFNNLKIDEDYQMSVYNNNLNDMTGSLSATESMALAYSFTLAIHETSGKNCPLVVDSPLGRVSDDNRKNMANELLKISQKKQIILLFTSDEYSKEVAEIYDSTIATIQDVSLTEDEQEIRKIGV